VKAALKKVEDAILHDHIEHCVEHAIISGDAADQRRKIAELVQLLTHATS
jgi:DNA-binding FrmR family transcriptional regulator